MTEPEPISQTWFSPNRGKQMPDGTIVVPAGGTSEEGGIWDGFINIAPDDADYAFWLWLLKRWPYHSTLWSHDIPTLKGEFARESS